MSKQTRWFENLTKASEFMVGRLNAKMRSVGAWAVTWDDGEPEPAPAPSFDRIVSRNGGDGKVEAPVEIVQRLKVKSVGMECDDSFYVCVCFPGQEHGSVFIPIPQSDTRRFTVGSEIEVVLRPAPLA